MATPKKKHLIELMIETGVKWPDGAEYAAQDKRDLKVNCYKNGKPDFQSCYREWMANDCYFMGDDGIELDSLCRNWHQTIVTREQYEKALADSGSGQVGEMPSDEPVASAMPSIEQLAANYHAKAEEAQRLQSVADNALKLADDALAALEKAGEAIGLVISITTIKYS